MKSLWKCLAHAAIVTGVSTCSTATLLAQDVNQVGVVRISKLKSSNFGAATVQPVSAMQIQGAPQPPHASPMPAQVSPTPIQTSPMPAQASPMQSQGGCAAVSAGPVGSSSPTCSMTTSPSTSVMYCDSTGMCDETYKFSRRQMLRQSMQERRCQRRALFESRTSCEDGSCDQGFGTSCRGGTCGLFGDSGGHGNWLGRGHSSCYGNNCGQDGCSSPGCLSHQAMLDYFRCKFGYFIPSGGGGKGVPIAGHYGRVYPIDPHYSDPRDSQTYAAQGYGVPMSVPLAPVVGHTYDYGWGIPSSRLTPISHPAY